MSEARARKLFIDFHGRWPTDKDIVKLKPTEGETALRVGKLSGVLYVTDDGEEFIHEFAKSDRPALFVSSDGQQAYIVAGRYRFTARGFVD